LGSFLRLIDLGWTREIFKMAEIGFKARKMGSALDRTLLNDAQWERIAPLLPGKEGDPGRSGLFVEAVLWLVRTGAAWRDLQELRQVVLRVETLPAVGAQRRVRANFAALSEDPDFRNMRSSTARSSRFTGTALAQKGIQNQAIGKV
jgi:hypothetical protein